MSGIQTVTIEMRMADLLERAAAYQHPCRACGVELYFIRHRNGVLAPYTIDGENHFIACPKANEFRKRRGER